MSLSTTNTYSSIAVAVVNVSEQSGNNYSFIEGTAGTYTNSDLKGISGTSYTMNVSIGGKVYSPKSTMPPLVGLDSVTYTAMDDDPKKKKIIVEAFRPSLSSNNNQHSAFKT